MRLRDFAVVEFARAWQEEAGASSVDPAVVDAVRPDLPDGDADRLLSYSHALLETRVDADEGRRALAHLRGALDGLHVAAPLLGALTGGALLAATLPPPTARPVNVFLFAGEGVLLPAIFGVLTLVLSLGAGRWLLNLHPLAWLGGFLARGALSTRLGGLTGRVLRTSGVSGPLFGSLSHLFWIGALTAFVGLGAWRFLLTDYQFAWASTMPLTGDGVRQVFSVLAAPIDWLPDVSPPTAEQVAVSEWASLADGYAQSTGDALRDERLRKGWYALLLAAVAFWGLLPRLAFFGASRLILRRRVRRALDAPAGQAILDALAAPKVETLAEGDGHGEAATLLPPSAPPDASARRAGLDLVAFATPTPDESTLERLRLARLGLSGAVHAVPEDDDDDAMDAALAALGSGAGGAVVAFAVVSSPGRLRESFLRDLVSAVDGGPVHVLLTGVDRFRRSPRGRSWDQRRGAWAAMIERVGIPADRLHTDGADA